LPELPEIAHLKSSLEPELVGAVFQDVFLARSDVVRNIGHGRIPTRILRRKLLLGEQVARLERHGKELAILARSGPAICVHLGMSGQLRHYPGRRRLERSDHVHCQWRLASGGGRLVFRDPRRFGGLWVFASRAELLECRWSRLGPDALGIDTPTLRARLARTRRPVKAALLDQRLVAGIGNIYVDEALFEAGIHPLEIAADLDPGAVRVLAGTCRKVLRRAVAAGGSTIRDYRDGSGRSGGYSLRHQVYGRAGQPCVRCGHALRGVRLSQRATVFCPRCQRGQRRSGASVTP
jgi:formamidopyrimidine-DNA glycosylase